MKNIINYVFVHGAWHGSWCFTKKIVPGLIKKTNAKVFAHDLPGHFNNKCDFKEINLKRYVDSVSDFIQKNIEGKVILVGHSIGGVVISQVGENLPERISHLVYISAFIPSKTGTLLDEEKRAKFPDIALKVKIDQENHKISLDKELCINFFYHKCQKEDISFALANIQSQPLLPFISRVSLGSNFDNIPKTYIECNQDRAIHIEDQRRMNKICDQIFSLDTDHSPFFSASDELIEILYSVAETDNE